MKVNTQYTVIKQFVDESKLKILANGIGVDSTELLAAYHDSMCRNRFAGVLIDNHISQILKNY